MLMIGQNIFLPISNTEFVVKNILSRIRLEAITVWTHVLNFINFENSIILLLQCLAVLTLSGIFIIAGTSFSKTLDGTAPEGGTVARVVAMKQTSQRLDAKGAYQTLDQGEALTGSIIVKLFLEDFDSNPVSLNSTIEVSVKTTSGVSASDFQVKVPDNAVWTTLSLEKRIDGEFFEADVSAADVARGPGIIRIDVPDQWIKICQWVR